MKQRPDAPVVALDIDGTLGPCELGGSRQSRKVWKRAYGPIPEGMQVRHKCDTKFCRRLDHLELGTAADNTADMHQRGRYGRPGLKLSDEQVAELRAMRARGVPCKEVAAYFGIHPMTVSYINNGRWRGAQST